MHYLLLILLHRRRLPRSSDDPVATGAGRTVAGGATLEVTWAIVWTNVEGTQALNYST